MHTHAEIYSAKRVPSEGGDAYESRLQNSRSRAFAKTINARKKGGYATLSNWPSRRSVVLRVQVIIFMYFFFLKSKKSTTVEVLRTRDDRAIIVGVVFFSKSFYPGGSDVSVF